MTFSPIKYDTTKIGGITVFPPIVNPFFDWTVDLPTYEPQRFIYDLNECSQLGGFITPLETYFNRLKRLGLLSQSFLDFCTANGYFDSNEKFSFSERFTGILDGTSINGNTMQSAWLCGQRFGILPRSKLNWTLADAAQFPNQALMDTSYYNPAVITQDMIDLAAAFKTFANVSWGWCADGTTGMTLEQLTNALKTSPIALAGPVPSPVELWNQVNVPYTSNSDIVHCFCGYKIDSTQINPVYIADQYQPWLKQLAINYYLPIGIIFHVELT